jgi:hypothetical protein
VRRPRTTRRTGHLEPTAVADDDGGHQRHGPERQPHPGLPPGDARGPAGEAAADDPRDDDVVERDGDVQGDGGLGDEEPGDERGDGPPHPTADGKEIAAGSATVVTRAASSTPRTSGTATEEAGRDGQSSSSVVVFSTSSSSK